MSVGVLQLIYLEYRINVLDRLHRVLCIYSGKHQSESIDILGVGKGEVIVSSPGHKLTFFGENQTFLVYVDFFSSILAVPWGATMQILLQQENP